MRFAQPLERGRLVRRYKRFLADIVTDEGEAMCIHCP
ncbi:MAG TPA: DNA/RNA nuclease SfsA, partial [Pseudomonas sp.]|nr:DNA/RNA nuclease SfsA [Pseudomonas sp.]